MNPVGILYDSVSNNTGDKAIGEVMRQLLASWGIPHEVVDPFHVRPERYSSLVIGGGELIGPRDEEFYDSFRVPGRHILNTVGLRSANDLSFLRDYRYVSVRSTADRDMIKHIEPDIDVEVVPCVSMLLEPESSHLDLDGAIGVHIHHGVSIDLQEVADALKKFSGSHRIVFLPFTHYTGDHFVLKALSEVVPNSIVAPLLSPGQLFDAIGRLRCLVAASLHAVIFAYTQNTPVISFPVANKIAHFLNDRQLLDHLIDSKETLFRKLEKMLDEPVDYSALVTRDKSALAQHSLRIRQLLVEQTAPQRGRPSIHSASIGQKPTAQAATQRRNQHEQAHSSLQQVSALTAERLRLTDRLSHLQDTINVLHETASRNEAEHAEHIGELEREIGALREQNKEQCAALSVNLIAWQRRALDAENAYNLLLNTRGMKVVSSWWRTKAAIARTAGLPVQRGRQLVQRSALMLRTEGPLAFSTRLGRWLRGERRYYGPRALIRATQESHLQLAQEADRLLALRTPMQNPIVPRQDEAGTSAAFDTLGITDQRALANWGRARLHAFLATGQRLRFPDTPDPRVSIIIPVFNQAHFTYLTLENLLGTLQDSRYEIVIADDASTDETPQLLKQLLNVRVHRNLSNAGFGETCNRGAELARGEYICFLNSDTLAMPGWLDALVDVLDNQPLCGAVGAKLVFPDLRLQEAGSIIWRDGSALGYGRNRDPFAPEYCYRREVDYCSAACLLIRAALFRQLGGFDPRYAPAYYEDADLCMAIKRAGYTVAFAPRAVVFHLEHATSGRSTAIALQTRNQGHFVAKWRDELANRGMPGHQDELRCRDSRQGKRVLVIDDLVPLQQLGSGFPRTLAMVDALVGAGYVATYLPATDPRPYEPATSDLQQAGVEVLYGVSDVVGQVRERTGLYDVVIISRPHNANLIEIAREANPRALIVYDAEAIFTLRDARQAEVERAPLSATEVESRIRREFSLAASADLVLTVSQLEQRTLQQYFADLPVAVWGHAMPLQRVERDFPERSGLAFVGYLSSAPNSDAVLHLLQDILPPIFAEIDCRMVIAGSGASPEALAGAEPLGEKVNWAGFVEDLGTLFKRPRVFVAPHRFAAGIPIKVIEAMAYGVPCVISELLGRQLGVTDGHEALVATDARDFSAKVVRLHQDEALWRQIQANAREYVAANYAPAVMRKALAEVIEEGVERQRRTTASSQHSKTTVAITPSAG